MNKETIEERALLYALGTLPEDETAEFEAQIRRDGALRAMVHENQLLNELDAAQGEVVEPPFHLFPRIMARVDGDAGDAVAAGEARPVSARRRGAERPLSFFTWGGWGLAACAGLALGLVLMTQGPDAEPSGDIVLNTLANPRLVPVQTPSEEFGLEDRMLELAGLAEAYWFSREGVPEGQRLNESGADVARLSGGFTIFDRKYQIGFIAVENLPRESEGKFYHVWASRKQGGSAVRAGALPIGDETRGLFFFDLSGGPQISSTEGIEFFVTEESSQEPTRPTGLVVLR